VSHIICVWFKQGYYKLLTLLFSIVCLTPQAALYCLEEEEAPLLQYLANARDLLGKPLYDPQTALRLARQRNKLQACVQLLCDLNLYEVRASSLNPEASKVVL